MPYTMIYMLVEGDDDERFFNRLIKPVLERMYDYVVVTKYAQMKPHKVIALVRSIRAMQADYVFVRDINSAPCVSARKQTVQETYTTVEQEKTLIVVKEIEGWYLAGLDHLASRKLGIRFSGRTDGISKEMFDNLIPPKYDSRINFLVEILNNFSLVAARETNYSFDYLIRKYVIEGKAVC